MKANRKFVEGKEAVSAVIGVILMVAITVAIAATVYVYVSGILGPGPAQTPTVTILQKGNYVSIEKVVYPTSISLSDVKAYFLYTNGTSAGEGDINDINGDNCLSGGDTISPPSGLASGTYTCKLVWKGQSIATCEFVMT